MLNKRLLAYTALLCLPSFVQTNQKTQIFGGNNLASVIGRLDASYISPECKQHNDEIEQLVNCFVDEAKYVKRIPESEISMRKFKQDAGIQKIEKQYEESKLKNSCFPFLHFKRPHLPSWKQIRSKFSFTHKSKIITIADLGKEEQRTGLFACLPIFRKK